MDDQEFFYRAKLALQNRWWHAKEPKVASIGRELSAVKQWRSQVNDDDVLILALELREGPPIAFLYAHKRGRHGDMHQLLAKARQHIDSPKSMKRVGQVLRDALDAADSDAA